jgi:hypothetical protein
LCLPISDNCILHHA